MLKSLCDFPRLSSRALRCQGFTLIELITVIIILAVLATVSTQFIVSATESYNDTQTRAKLTAYGRLVMERITRQLRMALPNSVREQDGGSCLQFYPVAGGGNYLVDVPDSTNGKANSGTLVTAPYSIDQPPSSYLAIGALQPSEVYGASPASLAAVASMAATSINFAARQWLRNSINRRFYLLNPSEAFCYEVNAGVGELRHFSNLTPTATVNGTGSHELLAVNVSPSLGIGSLFEIASSTENRNAVVTINIDFSEGGETLTFAQEVMVRNVP